MFESGFHLMLPPRIQWVELYGVEKEFGNGFIGIFNFITFMIKFERDFRNQIFQSYDFTAPSRNGGKPKSAI